MSSERLSHGQAVRGLVPRAVFSPILAAAFAACAGTAGTSLGPDAPRPRLAAGMDTASATSYHRRGVELLRRDPAAAAAHFQWASRLAPDRVEPLHGWRAALLIQNLQNLSQLLYSSGRQSPTSRLADSLFYEGMVRAPFAWRQYDVEVRTALLETFEEQLAAQGYNRGVAGRALQEELREGDPELRAWDHYVRREWEQALTDFAAALEHAKGEERGHLHVERAHVFGVSGQLAQAREEMAAALEAFNTEEERETELRPFYDSKAMYQYIIGALWEVEGESSEARAAFGKAVVEDMSFHPAHVSLARLALAEGDTATALSEYGLAADLRPDDAVLRVHYADFLSTLGEVDQAIAGLQAAIAVNPWWAAPHRALGTLCEERQDYAAALEAYDGFLTRAAADDPERKWTQERRDDVASRIK